MSSSEIMHALSNEVERNNRYQAPSKVTKAGLLDSRHEAEHVLAIRDFERDARERVAATAVEAADDIAWIEGRARVNTEAKFAIDRAQKETNIIAQGDPVKEAKFAILDDEFFAHVRARANKPRISRSDRLF